MHAFKKNLGGSVSDKLLFWGPALEDMFSQAADIVYNWHTTGGGALPAPTKPTGPPKRHP
jgi:hypothetical protein